VGKSRADHGVRPAAKLARILRYSKYVSASVKEISRWEKDEHKGSIQRFRKVVLEITKVSRYSRTSPDIRGRVRTCHGRKKKIYYRVCTKGWDNTVCFPSMRVRKVR